MARLPGLGRDGSEYTDFHGGFGVTWGGTHTLSSSRPQEGGRGRDHFAVTTENPVRWPKPSASGSRASRCVSSTRNRATMDAIRAREPRPGATRLKMEGSYHGHHDSVLFSVVPEATRGMRFDVDQAGKSWYTTRPHPKGPRGALDTTTSRRSTTRLRSRQPSPQPGHDRRVILEPVMMNIGIVVPEGLPAGAEIL